MKRNQAINFAIVVLKQRRDSITENFMSSDDDVAKKCDEAIDILNKLKEK